MEQADAVICGQLPELNENGIASDMQAFKWQIASNCPE